MVTSHAPRYSLYLDESGDHGILNVNPDYPVLALCGLAVEDEYYARVLLSQLDQFKVDRIGSASVRLHYRAMALRAGPFKFLADATAAWTFERALGQLIADLEATVFCAVIHKSEYVARYGQTRPVDEYLPTNLYLMTLDFVLERFVKFLEECGSAQGAVVAEARGRTEDAEVAAEYDELLHSGTQFVSGERFRRALAPTMRFAAKPDRVGGLELADVCAAPIATQVLKPGHVSPVWDAIRAKIWVSTAQTKGNVGLKCFPRSSKLDSLYESIGG